MTRPANPVYVALDTPDVKRALALGESLSGLVGGLKLGLEFFSAVGPEGVRAVVRLGLPVFLDVKLHDIPNTVAGAVQALRHLGVAIANVHVSGGLAMMRAAKAAAGPDMKLIGVTVLTSLDVADLHAMGVAGPPRTQVLRLARLARDAGLDGVVCAAAEADSVHEACGAGFLTIVPGIRPAGSDAQDQKRIMTPPQARAAGADILVIGRPITGADDPSAAARSIAESLGVL